MKNYSKKFKYARMKKYEIRKSNLGLRMVKKSNGGKVL